MDAEQAGALRISAYLEHYLYSYSLKRHSFEDNQDRWIVDIGYEKISIAGFVTGLLRDIKKDKILGPRFLHFYAKPQYNHRIYHNQMSLVFKSDASFMQKEIVMEIKKFFIRRSRKGSLLLSPSVLYGNAHHNREVLYDFEPVAIEVSALVELQVRKEKKFDEERFLMMAVILTGYIIRSLNLDINDVIKSNFYLMQRWIFQSKEQRLHLSNLTRLKAYKYGLYNLYYLNHQELIGNCIRKGMLLAANPSDEHKDYDRIVFELNGYFGGIVPAVSVKPCHFKRSYNYIKKMVLFLFQYPFPQGFSL